MAQELIGCNEYTLEGVKALKILTNQVSGEPIIYPVDFILYNNDDGVIQVSEDVENQTMTIGGQVLSYVRVDSFDMCEFEDERQETRQGIWFNKKITILVPKPQLYTHNQFIDFLFNVDGKYAVSNCMIAIEDSIGQHFLIGYDVPCILESMEISTDAMDSTDNKYEVIYNSKSYSRLRRYQVV